VQLPAFVRCPRCRSPLDGLRCTGCGREYAAEEGIARLLDPEAPGLAAKLREVAGWPKLAREQGWYEHGFALLLERLRPGLRVLEIGAAKSWAAQHLVPLGCEYVAADLVVDPVIGLGRGAFFQERVGPYLRVQADGERLPFADGAFDVAYCVATLHHALDLGAMVRELARVTRRGGLVAALNEGTRGPFRSGANPEQEHERELGINEHVHTIWAYLAAFARAHLVPTRIEWGEGPDALRSRRTAAQLLRAGALPATLWALNRDAYGGVSLFARRF
jgi:SAM-dependent methyltransferase